MHLKHPSKESSANFTPEISVVSFHQQQFTKKTTYQRSLRVPVQRGFQQKIRLPPPLSNMPERWRGGRFSSWACLKITPKVPKSSKNRKSIFLETHPVSCQRNESWVSRILFAKHRQFLEALGYSEGKAWEF